MYLQPRSFGLGSLNQGLLKCGAGKGKAATCQPICSEDPWHAFTFALSTFLISAPPTIPSFTTLQPIGHKQRSMAEVPAKGQLPGGLVREDHLPKERTDGNCQGTSPIKRLEVLFEVASSEKKRTVRNVRMVLMRVSASQGPMYESHGTQGRSQKTLLMKSLETN